MSEDEHNERRVEDEEAEEKKKKSIFMSSCIKLVSGWFHAFALFIIFVIYSFVSKKKKIIMCWACLPCSVVETDNKTKEIYRMQRGQKNSSNNQIQKNSECVCVCFVGSLFLRCNVSRLVIVCNI